MRRIAVCGLIVLFFQIGAARAADQKGQRLEIPTATRTVPVTFFQAAGKEDAKAKRPAVLVLHGAGGLTRFRRAFESYCLGLAHFGFDTYLVEYFVDGNESAGGSAIYERFAAWTAAVDGVADYLLKQPESNGRVGMVGFSNGGILAAGAGATDEKIAAAVIYYGAVPWPLQKPPARFPPLLILHGAQDAVIPVGEGKRLEHIAKSLGGSAELVVYPDSGHGFGIAVRDDATPDALRRTVAFLKRHLASP